MDCLYRGDCADSVLMGCPVTDYATHIITALRACEELCTHVIADADENPLRREEAAKVLAIIQTVLLFPKE